MLDELLPYYERELAFLREHSGEFASRYPKIARRLQIEGDQCEDPHVERLIEAFAFMAARIHRKLDDEFPQITEAFLQVLYPHYLRPVPSATILQLELNPSKPEVTGRYTLPRGLQVSSPEVQGIRCRFRTCFETHLWPISVAGARVELAQASEFLRRTTGAAAAITVDLESHGQLPWGSLGVDRLRFFLDGEPLLSSLLYELLGFRLTGIRVSDGREHARHLATLPASALRLVGFEPGEAMLGDDRRVFEGFRLIQEYLAFPDKFLFVELGGLDAATLQHAGNRLRIQFLLDRFGESERHHRLVERLGPEHLRLGCVPIVNLFEQAAEPIRITHERSAYPLYPDARRPHGHEVYAIENVVRVERQGQVSQAETVHSLFDPSGAERKSGHFYWIAQREFSPRPGDRGTDVSLTLVDLDCAPQRPEGEVLSVELTCTNRDLPELIPFGGSESHAQADFLVPQHPAIKRARLLRKPTPSLRPPMRGGMHWRLISHLTLNHLSLAAQGPGPLRELLGLYNFSDSQALGRQIQGLQNLASRPVTTRLKGPDLPVFVRGMEATATVDESAFVGANLHLFGGVLSHLLGSFAPPNSFVQFRIQSTQHPDEVVAWPPRAGDRALI